MWQCWVVEGWSEGGDVVPNLAETPQPFQRTSLVDAWHYKPLGAPFVVKPHTVPFLSHRQQNGRRINYLQHTVSS